MKKLLFFVLLLAACGKNTSVSGPPPSPPLPPPPINKPDTSFLTTAYVEVNNNSFHNPGCYIYGSKSKPVFTIAVIFAANINSANGKPALYFNPQVQSTLNSGDVAYLRSLGIKVLLTVLGNHQNAGWGCFDNYNDADSFAIQCASAISSYGLDGIDIDDEYSACTTNNNSLVFALTALRARLGPSKYITKALFKDAQYFSASYNGKKAGDILDFGWEMSYGNGDYAGRLRPYLQAGMSAGKLFVGVDIGETDEAAAAGFVRQNGYAGLMTYNIGNGSQAALSLVTNALFDTATGVRSGCLQ